MLCDLVSLVRMAYETQLDKRWHQNGWATTALAGVAGGELRAPYLSVHAPAEEDEGTGNMDLWKAEVARKFFRWFGYACFRHSAGVE